MADDDHKREKGSDFYGVLGLRKECTATELRNAYKKLAMRWHPDRCSATGNAKFVEEAKKKFQAIQEAYSVLSDTDKRFMYDVGVYDNDDDDNMQGMGDFLNEMAAMMSQTKCSSESGEESFEKLQELFKEMFQEDVNAFGSGSQNAKNSTTTYRTYCECSSSNNKRNSTEMNFGKTKVEDSAGFDTHFQSFCFGVEQHQDPRKGKGITGGGIPGGAAGSRRDGRKQKVSFGHDVSSNDYSGISA